MALLKERIKQKRLEQGLTTAQVAEALKISEEKIWMYENGMIQKMPLELLDRYARVLKTSPSYLEGLDTVEPIDCVKGMETFLKVLDSCLTEEQVKTLRFALKANAKVYFYGHGLGKSLITEALRNAGFDADEPGTDLNAEGPMEVRDVENTVAFCVKNTPKERIPDVYALLLGCSKEIIDWVNQ